MREILFRGKRKDDQSWEYGNYSHYCFSSDMHIGHYINGFEYEVYPESVGQYTGLPDCLGNKVFEGDILDCGDRIVKVVWNLNCGTWDCDFIRYTNQPLFHSNGIAPVEWKYRAKIIGNIFDNPELL